MVAGHLQTKKGYYYMVLNLKSEDGNRKSKWISTGIPATGKKSAKLAEEMLAETRCTYKDAASPCAGSPVISREDISFSDYMIKWLGIIKNSVEVDTYAGYVNNIEKRIVPYFRGQRILLRELTALDVENFYSYCFNELHLKGTTVQRFHANIHKAMKYARKHDLIASNPMDNVERPKSQRYVGAFYSVSELETLFQAVKGDPCEFPVLMAAFYGLRRSEIMGLRWRAIDFENNLITIDHTVVQCMCDGTTITVEKDRTKKSVKLPLNAIGSAIPRPFVAYESTAGMLSEVVWKLLYRKRVYLCKRYGRTLSAELCNTAFQARLEEKSLAQYSLSRFETYLRFAAAEKWCTNEGYTGVAWTQQL